MQPKFKLKARVLELFGNQYMLAQKLGVRDDELSSFIRGRKQLSYDRLEDLRKLLNLTREEFNALVAEEAFND